MVSLVSPALIRFRRRQTFCERVAKGEEPNAVARDMGYDATGTQLMRRDDYQAVMTMLNAEAKAAAIATLAERQEALSKIVRTDLQPATIQPQHVIAASDQLNKLQGSYPPTDVRVAAAVEIRVVYDGGSA